MNKIYIDRHPKINERQVSFTRTLVSMLNCRRYLNSQGFDEQFDGQSYYTDTNAISGTVIFPDGSEVNHNSFCNTANTQSRDAILERAIDKEARFKRLGFDMGYTRSGLIRTNFAGNGYSFKLSVRDTTREKSFFPIKLFLYNPRLFTFEYGLGLVKQVITDQDLQEFEKYRQGLDFAMKQKNLLAYVSQVPQRMRTASKEVEVPHQRIDFVNPWEIEIPKIGGKKNE